MSVSFTISGDSWVTRAGQATEKIRSSRDEAVNLWMLGFITRLQTERLNGNPLKRRTGNLANQWTTVNVATADRSSFSVKSTAGLDQSGKGYSLLQEHGGEVRPKNGKYLWIPIGDNLTAAGVPRMTPTQAIQAGGFISWKRGPIFFGVDQKGRSRKSGGLGIHPLFVLKRSVNVPARMGATAMWNEEAQSLKSKLSTAIKGAILG